MLLLQKIGVLLTVLLIALLGMEIFLRVRSYRAKSRPPTPPLEEANAKDTPREPLQDPPVREETVTAAEIPSADLLQEADIYLQYGHYEQAATVLRWYVDLHPTDLQATNKLLDTYDAMADLDSYTALLAGLEESLDRGQGAVVQDTAWWRQRIQMGLAKDPGNLELLVLAEKFGVVPHPSPEEPERTASQTLAMVARSTDFASSLAILHAAILKEPFSLPLYAELLRITHQQRDLQGFADGLLLLAIALGEKGDAILTRMLRAGRALGPSEFWDQLEKLRTHPVKLRELAKQRGLTLSPRLPSIS